MALDTSLASCQVLPQEILEMIVGVQKGIQEDGCGRMLLETKNMWSEWKEIMKMREDRIRQDMEALLAGCKEAEEEAASTVDPATKRKVEELEQQLKISEQHCEEVGKAVTGLTAQKAQSMKELEKLYVDCQKAKAETSESISAIKNKYSLLRNMTAITWKTDGSADEVAGCVFNRSGPHHFSLNRKENSPLFIADYIWGTMEPDW